MLTRKADLRRFLLAEVRARRPGWTCTRISPDFIELTERKAHQFLAEYLAGQLSYQLPSEPLPKLLYDTRVREEFKRLLMTKYSVLTELKVGRHLTPFITARLVMWLGHQIHAHRSKGKTFDP